MRGGVANMGRFIRDTGAVSSVRTSVTHVQK